MLVYRRAMYFETRTPIFLHLGFTEKTLPRLKAYVDLLWSSNEELNLISRKMTYEDLIDNHVIDSLLALSHFPTDVKVVADFGSGGGLPAVIFALQFPQIKFHLFEKSPLKQDFLQLCKKIAPNIEIFGDIPIKLPNVDIITARGFKPLDVILDMSREFYKSKHRYFLLKARREKIDEELALTQKKFKDVNISIVPLKSPVLEVERHLVVIS
ncbi:MAG: 16S rRNA (guanine(527)-N(7))-methyltransferase RsmG [Bdellovibrionaceae bacterium]|nr:16S rRNA (guanine(527)-N(7))-methyltransferase RsmG [Pseudobdellovibrionaceae bacterium]